MGFRDMCPRPARSWCEGSSIRPLTPRHPPTQKSKERQELGCGYGCGDERGRGRGRAAAPRGRAYTALAERVSERTFRDASSSLFFFVAAQSLAASRHANPPSLNPWREARGRVAGHSVLTYRLVCVGPEFYLKLYEQRYRRDRKIARLL